jgi:hypothetical protein
MDRTGFADDCRRHHSGRKLGLNAQADAAFSARAGTGTSAYTPGRSTYWIKLKKGPASPAMRAAFI